MKLHFSKNLLMILIMLPVCIYAAMPIERDSQFNIDENNNKLAVKERLNEAGVYNNVITKKENLEKGVTATKILEATLVSVYLYAFEDTESIENTIKMYEN